jgi:hypothetical protein
MHNKILYSFDDQIASKFCYDIDNKKIEVSFEGYSDLIKNEFINTSCTFIIENWKDAKSKMVDEQKKYELNKYIGIFSMILYMEIRDSSFEMIVNTIDNKYITLIFLEPKLSLI